MSVLGFSRLAALATALTTVLPMPATADAAVRSGDFSYVRGDGDATIAIIKFDGRNLEPEGTRATGKFDGQNPTLHFKGPIICLQVEKNRAGFIYPVDNTSEPAAARGTNILISIEDDGGNGKMGFSPLPPGADVSHCPPGPTPNRLRSGSITVHDARSAEG